MFVQSEINVDNTNIVVYLQKLSDVSDLKKITTGYAFEAPSFSVDFVVWFA